MKCISGEHYYVTFALWHKPSVCRLSVCDVVAPSRHLNFSAIFLHLLIVQRLIQVVLKFRAKIKRRFFRPICGFISKMVQDRAIVTMADHRTWSIDWRHYQWQLSGEACCVSKQVASGLQAHRFADNCLQSCLYSGGVVQAVTFAYLIYWWVSCLF